MIERKYLYMVVLEVGGSEVEFSGMVTVKSTAKQSMEKIKTACLRDALDKNLAADGAEFLWAEVK